MFFRDTLSEAMGRSEARMAALAAAAQKSAGSGLVSNTMAGTGGANSPGMKWEQARHLTGWQFAVCRVIAQRIAAQPVRMARKGSGRPKKPANKQGLPAFLKALAAEALDQVESHALLDAIARPNPYLVGWQFLYLSLLYLEADGECYWWLTTDGGRLEIYPLHPAWVTPQHTDDVLFDHYKVTVRNTGETQTVPGEEMVRIHLPDPQDPYTGCLSPLRAQGKAIVADEKIQDAQVRAFSNGLFPGLGLIIGRHPDVAGVPGQRPILSKEQRASLTAALKQAYRGTHNAGEPVILDGLIEDVKKLTNSPEEMGFLESGKLTKDRITQGFGVNPITMGAIEGANRASATVADEHLLASAVNPLIELISQVMTYDLAPKLGEPDMVIWIEPARTRDPDAERLDRDQKLKSGCYTRNEVRSWYGDPPMDGGEGEQLVGPSALPPTTQEGGASGASFRFAG